MVADSTRQQSKKRQQKPWPKWSGVSWYLREAIAVLVWAYVVTKLLIIDIDILLVEVFAPQFSFFIKYKFLFVLGFVALAPLAFGRNRFTSLLWYVLSYPALILLWRVPKFALRHWAVAVVFLPAIEAFAKNIRLRVVIGIFAVYACVLIATSTSPFVILPSITYLSLYLLFHYGHRLRIAFHPTTAVASVGEGVRKTWSRPERLVKQELQAARATTKADSANPSKEDLKVLEKLLYLNLFSAFVAKKLRRVAGAVDAYFVGSFFFSVVLTVVVFAFVYLGIYRLDSSHFAIPDGSPLLYFLLFSFNTIMTAETSGVVAKTALAIFVANTELVAAVLLFFILVFVILTVVRDRHRKDMDELIDELERSETVIDNLLQAEYRLSLPQAEARLIAADSNFRTTIKRLRGDDPRSDDGGDVIEVAPTESAPDGAPKDTSSSS